MRYAKGFLYLTKLDILRTFRDLKYVVFIIAFPVIFYLLYTQIFDAQAQLDGISWATYAMISMAAFGVIGNAVTFMGTRVQKERDEKWYQFLKVSSVPEVAYNISRCVSYIVLSLISILLVVLAGISRGVKLEVSEYVVCIAALLIGSLVFVALALIVSCLGSAAQPIGTLLYLMLALIGGLWMPVISMPTLMQNIAKITPAYNYAKIVWDNIGGEGFPVKSALNLLAWTAAFLIIYLLVMKFQKKR